MYLSPVRWITLLLLIPKLSRLRRLTNEISRMPNETITEGRNHVEITVAVFKIQLSRRVIIYYSVARHSLCTPLCYANVYTMIERYRAHAARNYSIRRQITSYLSGERELWVHQQGVLLYVNIQRCQFLINVYHFEEDKVSRIHYVTG